MLCMSKVKVIPHQTVGWLIEQLEMHPKDLPVVFSTGTLQPLLYVLSDYTIDNDSVVCIDIGDES